MKQTSDSDSTSKNTWNKRKKHPFLYDLKTQKFLGHCHHELLISVIGALLTNVERGSYSPS